MGSSVPWSILTQSPPHNFHAVARTWSPKTLDNGLAYVLPTYISFFLDFPLRADSDQAEIRGWNSSGVHSEDRGWGPRKWLVAQQN